MTDHLDHMLPPAEYITEAYRDANKLEDKRVLSTGGDSAEEIRAGVEAEGAVTARKRQLEPSRR